MADQVAVITGFGAGFSERLALRLIEAGYVVVGLSRSGKFGEAFLRERNPERFVSYACDVSDPSGVSASFERIRNDCGSPSVLVHNAAELLLRDFLSIRPDEFESLWRTSCLGGMLAAQEVLPGMLERDAGTLIFSGATASVKAGPKSAAFAASKFALRGLAQSLARAYGPQGIHIVHTVIDGVIWGPRAEQEFGMAREKCIDPDHLAQVYLDLIRQPASCWSHEIDLRPPGESF